MQACRDLQWEVGLQEVIECSSQRDYLETFCRYTDRPSRCLTFVASRCCARVPEENFKIKSPQILAFVDNLT
jgi:hypothetical protein